MAESGCFEETSKQTRLLTKDPRYAALVAPFWGVLLDAASLLKGEYKIAYQFCRLKKGIEDENTLLIPGGAYYTVLDRAWTPEVAPVLQEFLHRYPTKAPYLLAEELAVFADVDSIRHQIFIPQA